MELLEWVQECLIETPKIIKIYTEGVQYERKIVNKIDKVYKSFISGNNEDRLIVVWGLRGVGKTTAICQFLSKVDIHPLFIFADVKEFYDLSLSDVVNAYKRIVKPPYVVVLDEAHIHKRWAEEVKNVFDKNKDIFLIISGSSALRLREKGILKRRAVYMHLCPVQYGEYLMIKGYDVKTDVKKALFSPNMYENIIREEFRAPDSAHSELWNYLKYHGLPVVFNRAEHLRYSILFDVVDRIITDDLRYISSFDSETLNKAKDILYSIAMAKDAKTSVNSISRDIGVSRTAVSAIIDGMVKSSLLIEVKSGGRSGLRKMPKYYFSSPSLRLSILDHLGEEPNIGMIREEAVVSNTVYSGFDIWYVPNRGRESDFIISNKRKKISVEVGGRSKDMKQLTGKNKMIISDTNKVEYVGVPKIPLYLYLLP
ncbi:ATP-binding protein [Candidatus Micrarchaeota archaeon]|nr:ATP-binding protein [Candidatus Micrarchaeota archaeon]